MKAIEAVLRQHRLMTPRPIFYDGRSLWCEGVEGANVALDYSSLAALLRSWGFKLMEPGITERWELV